MDAEGDLEAEAEADVVEVHPRDLADPVEAVEDGIAVDGQDGGRLLGGAVRPEERLQRLDQVSASSWNSRISFFNVWDGLRNRAAFQARPREDFGQVFALLADGTLTAQVAARLPLTEVAAAMRLAESGTVAGKVVLLPGPETPGTDRRE